MTISGLEMAQKRKCEIPPKDDDGIQILYEKYDRNTYGILNIYRYQF